MANALKQIGVLTSGGDAPGMNAAIRAVVRAGLAKSLRVTGVRRGYSGLMQGDFIDMNLRSVSDIVHHGGTILGTARSVEFRTDEGQYKAIGICREAGLDGLVVIGGDGSFAGARKLSLKGMPCIGIPGSIDNDISSSDYTIGFDSALNTVAIMVDRLRDTMESHDRCSVVEVMGNHCGDIALHAGLACGASAILVPEQPFDLENDIIPRLKAMQKSGKRDFIVMVSEGVGKTQEIADTIQKLTGIETRATVLGHVQRGGNPTVRDRVIASQMGYHAVELLAQGIGNRVIVMRDAKIVDLDINEALNMPRVFDSRLLTIANTINI